MKKPFILFFFVLFLLVLTLNVTSECTVEFDRVYPIPYFHLETITAEMSCSGNEEKNTAYTLTWINQTGFETLETDTGTTPNTPGENFYETFVIPSDYGNLTINATLSGTSLEGNNTANITTALTGSIIISNATFGGGYLGLVGSIQATVKDDNERKLSGGFCKISGWSNDETQMLLSQDTQMVDGEVKASEIMPPTRFDEGTQYAFKILCYCGSNGGATECINEDAVAVEDSVGSTKGAFTTLTWLETSTSTDLSSMNLKQLNTVSVNVTNNRTNLRVPIDIIYDCRIDRDDNYTRRIRSPFYFPECGSYGECTQRRGISAEATQEQGIDFMVEEHPFLQGRTTEAYCSTYVTIADVIEDTVTYATTSTVFNITSDEMNLEADWQRVERLKLNSIVNLSSTSYDDFNGTGIGNIDIRLHGGFDEVDLIHPIELFNLISNITVWNSTDQLVEHTHYELEFLEDDNIEIELRDVELDKYTGEVWYNLTVEFYDFEKRETEALEGIENKTGTFKLSVDCPTQGDAGSHILCVISAQVEDSQTVEKEVDFNCSIRQDGQNYSNLNFNQMITRDVSTIHKNFLIPSQLADNSIATLQCYATYYNLGKRTDTFSDTFIVDSDGDSGGAVAGPIGRVGAIPPIIGEIIKSFNFWILVGLTVLGLFAYGSYRKRGLIYFYYCYCKEWLLYRLGRREEKQNTY